MLRAQIAPAPPAVRHRRRSAPPCSPCAPSPRASPCAGSSTTSSCPASTRARSPPATVLTGVGLIIGIGLLRAAGVVVRRTFAGTTQWRIAGTLGRVGRSTASCASRWRGTTAGPTATSSPAPASTPTPPSASSRPIPFATGTVLLIVVSAVFMLATDVVLGAVAVAVFPRADRPQHRLPAARRRVLRRGPGPPRRALGRRPRELRGRAARQGLRRRGPRDRAPGRDRRPPARRPASAPSGCAARSRRCSTCCRR